jgi:very-short-patch-repair endonuclease
MVVEVDGGHHASQVEADQESSTYLEKKGFQVLRFWNNEVLNETESVLSLILDVLEGNSPNVTSHADPLPFRGEGG